MEQTSTAAIDACAEGALDTPGAVEFSGIRRSRLYELARAGRIRAIRLGRRTLWPRAELARLLSEHLDQPTA